MTTRIHPGTGRTCGCSGITELSAVSIVWAFSFGIIRSSLSGLDPSLVACLRMLLASLVMLPFLRAGRLPVRAVLLLMATGAVQFGLMYAVYIESFQSLEAWEVAMLTVTTPLFVAAFDWLACRRGGLPILVASTAAVAGGAILLWNRPSSPVFVDGLILVQLSNIFFAAGQIAFRRIDRAFEMPRTIQVIALMYLGGLIATLPGAIPAAGSILSLTMRQVAAVVYLGVVASGVCFMVWNQGATKVESGVLAAFNNAKIPLSVLASIVFFGERPSLWKLAAGSLLILAGVLAGRAVRSPEAPSDTHTREKTGPADT
ncbi:MAG TPA: DMT family transporter [Candidatus Fermentibacter daniensis]|nr:DMT family transporter [Candidatus Fermentibacter daniensis]